MTDPIAQATIAATSEVIKASAKTVYEDGLKPTIQETGKTLALIPRAINAALVPIEKWILHRNYSVDETKALLAEKLKNIPSEKIVPLEPYVGVPAIQAISYCMNNEALREMFANLLANSINIDTKSKVHPAFVDIIKQMSPLDAENLVLFKNRSNHPITQCRGKTQDGYKTIQTNFFLGNPKNNDTYPVAASLTNLQRLGLVDINYFVPLLPDNHYEKFKNHSFYIELEKIISADSNYVGFNLVKGSVEITPLGRLFIEICL